MAEGSKYTGLSEAEAARRLRETGPNQVSRGRRVSLARIFAGQFGDYMTLILIGCAGISAVLGEGREALAMLAIVLLNALIGFLQEVRTERTLEALSRLAAPTAKVLRDGARREIPAAEAVPGDVILLAAGDRVPADAELLDGGVSCDESLLTGESVPVDRVPAGENMVRMGTMVVKGSCTARVTATGMDTEMGRIAGMLDTIEPEPTPLARRLDHLGKTIAAGCLVICAAVAVLGVLRGESPFAMLVTGISLAVAAVPEGLPAIVTVSLALAVRRILKRGSLVKGLHTVETLGSAEVICTDKTGTLTENRMTVRSLWTPNGSLSVTGDGLSRTGTFLRDGRQTLELSADEGLLLTAFVLANDASLAPGPKNTWRTDGDPTEAALLIAGAKAGLGRELGRRLGERPFDSERKRMSVLIRMPEGEFLFAKGAPDRLMECCTRIRRDGRELPLSPAARAAALRENDRLAAEGYRVLAAAYKPKDAAGWEEGLCFLGLAAIADPVRPDAARAVRECLSAHIRPVLITGDHSLTAAAVAREVGILRPGCEGILTGEELAALPDRALEERLLTTAVYARVSPADKLRIVRAFQKKGLVTAMTGDGVNDAPALKEADIGVAMGKNGSDVAREASDLILLDDDFATLVAAIREGRAIYDNIRRSIRYLLSCNTGEVAAMLFGMLMGMPVVLTPIQLLLVNLATDGLPAIALGFEPPAEDLMRRRPRGREVSLLDGSVLSLIALRGLLIGFCALWAYGTVLVRTGDTGMARTAALLTLVFTQLIHCFECRSESGSLFAAGPFGNLRLTLAVAVSALLTIAAVQLPALAAVMGTVPLDRASAVVVAFACALGPLLWALGITLTKAPKDPDPTLSVPIKKSPDGSSEL